MYQQQMPHDEHEWQGTSYSGSEYNSGYKETPQYSDQLADAIAQRLRVEFQSRMRPASGPTAGQRLALAIVSLALLVPLASIIFAAAGAFGGLIGLGIICLGMVIVNAVFNYSF